MFITFVDEEKVVHLANMADCHLTSVRGNYAVEVKGRVFHVLQGTSWNIGDVAGIAGAFNQSVALLKSGGQS